MAVALSSWNSTAARDELYGQFHDKIKLNPDLNRQLVSYQADKETPVYRWFKYREGFTSRLVHYLVQRVHPEPGVLLDPFAGSGSALFASSALGWQTCGIEVLPVGVYAMEARKAADRVDPGLFCTTAEQLRAIEFEAYYEEQYSPKHIAITSGAYPLETERQLVGYVAYCNKHIESEDVRRLALYAGFCILEDISYTRKDGQYLRWDYRSGRSQGSRPFNKGRILTFSEAIRTKLDQMAWDISVMTGRSGIPMTGQMVLDFGEESDLEQRGKAISAHIPQVIKGSCLDVLPAVPSDSIDCLLTSPPYANRYDYTRTYALELVYLGCSHDEVTQLRQAMLSCTVENKAKREYMRTLYERLERASHFEKVEKAFQEQQALQEVLSILDNLRVRNELNNPHIASLVRNYFYEMCFVVSEMARVVRPGGHLIMVNDNVRYAGEEVPVDLILSSMSEQFGLEVERIWTLAGGKGNSSQQMGAHGRSELRKCVYLWRKPE
jgi:DNA modification methylase